MKSARIAYAASFAVTVLILWGTLATSGSSLRGPQGADKIAHAVVFAALVFPLVRVFPKNWLKYAFWATAYGAAIEVFQPFVGRTGDYVDMLANLCGVALGVAIGILLQRLSARG